MASTERAALDELRTLGHDDAIRALVRIARALRAEDQARTLRTEEIDLRSFDRANRLDRQERTRLLIRVICELVAYDETTSARSRDFSASQAESDPPWAQKISSAFHSGAS